MGLARATAALTAPASAGSLLRRLLPSGLNNSPDFRHAGRSHSGWQFNFILQPVFAFGAGGEMLLDPLRFIG